MEYNIWSDLPEQTNIEHLKDTLVRMIWGENHERPMKLELICHRNVMEQNVANTSYSVQSVSKSRTIIIIIGVLASSLGGVQWQTDWHRFFISSLQMFALFFSRSCRTKVVIIQLKRCVCVGRACVQLSTQMVWRQRGLFVYFFSFRNSINPIGHHCFLRSLPKFNQRTVYFSIIMSRRVIFVLVAAAAFQLIRDVDASHRYRRNLWSEQSPVGDPVRYGRGDPDLRAKSRFDDEWVVQITGGSLAANDLAHAMGYDIIGQVKPNYNYTSSLGFKYVWHHFVELEKLKCPCFFSFAVQMIDNVP